MLLDELDQAASKPTTILDIGCGNGRNSLALAQRYGSKVVLVDPDQSMLMWAQQSFESNKICFREICTSLEELATTEKTSFSLEGFDAVILSYVLQHIDPSNYPVIFDFLRNSCKGYLAIDIFWNPLRCEAGGFLRRGSRTWYGVKYEDVIKLLAPRFEIVRQRVSVTRSGVFINIVAKEGITPPERIIKKEYDYYLGSVRVDCRDPSHIGRRRTYPDLDTLSRFNHLSSLYPAEMDIAKVELKEWLQSSQHVDRKTIAAKLLWLCRANGIPITLKEVAGDFSMPTKKIAKTMIKTGYIPPLRTEHYVDRISRELNLDASLREKAGEILSKIQECDGRNPTVKAASAILIASKNLGIDLGATNLAGSIGISTLGLRISVRRMEEEVTGCGQ
jgi:SAM-dependent methyltransferase